MGTAALRLLPAELAHDIGMWMLRKGVMDFLPAPQAQIYNTSLQTTVPGLGALDHPIGLAAGFDKNCLAPFGFARMGLSFIEIGTVTPRPQPGNPKPRVFRYPKERALINRMGFNSDGAETVAARLKKLKWNHDQVPIGINVGKNKQTPPEEAVLDYMQVIEAFRDLGSYYVVNISSPNTPGLRDLANPDFIEMLARHLGSLVSNTWVKLDPDMDKKLVQDNIEALGNHGYQGVILSNTHRVTWPEVGGQSGHPLTSQSNCCLEWAYEVHRGSLPMIASGGILSGADIYQKLARGASAVQVYTALVYGGPWVVAELQEQLSAEMNLRGVETVAEIIGSLYDS
jgi:dihydroorotate dehydrogenase